MTHFSGLDDGLGCPSRLDRLSPRCRVILALMAVVTQASVTSWTSLGVTAIVPLVTVAFFGFSHSFKTLRRALITSFWIVTMVSLTWSTSQPRIWGIFSPEGFEAALKICARFHLISATLVPLVVALGVSRLEKVFKDFGVPEKFRLLLLLTVRSIFMVSHQVCTMNQALKLRGLRSCTALLACKGYGAMVGTTLIHCADRSERICQAITCRGGLAGFGRRHSDSWTQQDLWCCACCLLLNVIAWRVPQWLNI